MVVFVPERVRSDGANHADQHSDKRQADLPEIETVDGGEDEVEGTEEEVEDSEQDRGEETQVCDHYFHGEELEGSIHGAIYGPEYRAFVVFDWGFIAVVTGFGAEFTCFSTEKLVDYVRQEMQTKGGEKVVTYHWVICFRHQEDDAHE